MADNDHNNEKDKEEQKQDVSDETGSETPENQAEESGDAGEGEKKRSRSRTRRENTPDWDLIRTQVNKAEPISLEDEMKRSYLGTYRSRHRPHEQTSYAVCSTYCSIRTSQRAHGGEPASNRVRMAQDFSMRYPLVDGQGNFGSVDGDGAAAMRYTEVRLKKLSSEMLRGLDEDAVDFAPNYDARRKSRPFFRQCSPSC